MIVKFIFLGNTFEVYEDEIKSLEYKTRIEAKSIRVTKKFIKDRKDIKSFYGAYKKALYQKDLEELLK